MPGVEAARTDASKCGERLLEEWGLPRYRGRQVFERAPPAGRSRTTRRCECCRGSCATGLRRSCRSGCRRSRGGSRRRDGSVKYGLKLADGALIEAVFMPGEASQAQVNEFEDARAVRTRSSESRNPRSTVRSEDREIRNPKFTVCLSSQTGCAVDCAFCVTGRLGGGTEPHGRRDRRAALRGAATTSAARRRGAAGRLHGDGGAVSESRRRDRRARCPLRADLAAAASRSRHPASRRPSRRFAKLPRRPNLAVSINAADEETRTRLMPITRTYPLQGLVAAMREVAARAAPPRSRSSTS